MALHPLKLKSHTLSYHKQSQTLTQIRFIWTKQVGKVGEKKCGDETNKNRHIFSLSSNVYRWDRLFCIVSIWFSFFIPVIYFGSFSSLFVAKKYYEKKNDTPILFVEILNCFLLCVFVYGVSVSNHIRLWLLFVFPPHHHFAIYLVIIVIYF